MLRVGLTGGVVCGKSTVAGMFVQRGAHFLQADTLAHQVYAPGTAVHDRIVERFGREVLSHDGTINRAALANLVFPGRVAELNAIVHPAVIEAQNEWMRKTEAEDPHGIAVVEAALIIEAGVAADFDKIIVVTCDFEHKVEHYARRAGVALEIARKEVVRRSATQLTDEEKARHAHYVIDNSGTVDETQHQVEKIWPQLQSVARH